MSVARTAVAAVAALTVGAVLAYAAAMLLALTAAQTPTVPYYDHAPRVIAAHEDGCPGTHTTDIVPTGDGRVYCYD